MDPKSIFDMDKLLESTCDDRELAGQVVGVFLSDIPVQLASLDAAVATNDAKTAERASHSIKGASATVGAENLRVIAFTCEQLGREGNIDELKTKLSELKHHFETLNNALLAEGFVAE